LDVEMQGKVVVFGQVVSYIRTNTHAAARTKAQILTQRAVAGAERPRFGGAVCSRV
jgi:hypothetical protein